MVCPVSRLFSAWSSVGGGIGLWGGGVVCVCVGSTNSVVRGGVGRLPDGGVQVSGGGEYRFV